MAEQLYDVIRFHRDKRNRKIKKGVTLQEAQEHCADPKTHGKDGQGYTVWFDGFEPQEVKVEKPRRYKNGSKLSSDDVREIKRILADKKMTQKELAKRYTISITTINHINTGRIWAEIQP